LTSDQTRPIEDHYRMEPTGEKPDQIAPVEALHRRLGPPLDAAQREIEE
jgi:hypothetical protein